jgi:hypothetical protein
MRAHLKSILDMAIKRWKEWAMQCFPGSPSNVEGAGEVCLRQRARGELTGIE